MQDEILLPDQSGQWQGREGLGEHLENTLGVFGLALALESVDLVHVIRLVVATVEEQAVRTQPLVGVEKKSDFARPRATVDKVAVEEISVGVGGAAVSAEDLQQIKELAWCLLVPDLFQDVRRKE